jgi:hypothetical protein
MTDDFLKMLIKKSYPQIKTDDISRKKHILNNYFIPDLNPSNCRVLFILESPNLHEVYEDGDKDNNFIKAKNRLPAVNIAGLKLSSMLGLDDSQTLSEHIKDGNQDYGIMEVSNLPLQNVYKNTDLAQISEIVLNIGTIKNCFTTKNYGGRYNLEMHKLLLKELIKNNIAVKALLKDFKFRLQKCYEGKLLVPMGVISQVFFEEIFNVKYSMNKLSSTSNKVHYCFSYHPTDKGNGFETNKNKLKDILFNYIENK